MPLRDSIRQDEVFLAGRWQPSEGGQLIDVRHPGNGELVGRARLASIADVDRAVAAARRSFDDGRWRAVPPAERSAVLHRAADILAAQADELADLMVSELGCPHSFARDHHIPSPLRNLRYYADLAASYRYDEIRTDGKYHSVVTAEPVGVCAAITPWNAPLGTPILKVAPALAAGCSVVLKPAPETPLTVARLGEALAQAGLPEGVFSMLPGDREVGAYLVEHPQVDKVGFTGSTAAGRAIMSACGQRIARVTLELGGKSAAIVLDDADIDAVVPALMPMAMMLSGQACIAQTRVLVPRRLAAPMRDALAEALRAQTVGDPFDPDTVIGPLVSERQRERVLGYVDIATAAGASVVTGGGVPAGLDRGWFVSPTLLDKVDNTSQVAQEEIFGPVISLISYDDDTDAVRMANDSIYGLSGSVWSTDTDRAVALARQVRTGMVSINGFPQAKGTPFGGFKQSGIGREMGPEGLQAYLETKSIAIGPAADAQAQ